ncbi:similar to Saccharomyces cerevisiae YJL145W SFH5 Non-classical phosphatidylinositol transfer protein (PITP) [Maudiozyma saulgeensis]|uniref:Phosphatidylinositol transfer protein SFH5 n=1 Tax=Maudiozyma saulgeensis TaxID=1789683 RepID=A0A1X7RB05_9SACH|nr:similar to Saccharomyces cerevisiae YJL145W SFH5 Non-classical phosphatidylinositol transfer protein (PITP) [Kazachstania saulgeensis]
MKFDTKENEAVFKKVKNQLPELIETQCKGYDEIYGYKIIPGNDENLTKFYNEDIVNAIIFKFCKGYKFQYSIVVEKIKNVLNWRREFNPLSAAYQEVHDPELVEVGLLTHYPNEESNKKIITWNIYGKLVKKKHLFKEANKFLRYRIGLMERSLRLIDFTDNDNNYMAQVHDYKGTSVWKMDSDMKRCVKDIISIFQDYYPELLSAKYFVYVPTFLGWVYDVIKKFVDESTRKKFVVLNDGKKLGKYISNCPSIPYGGKDTKSLQEQNIAEIRPSEYAQYLLEKQIIEDVD